MVSVKYISGPLTNLIRFANRGDKITILSPLFANPVSIRFANRGDKITILSPLFANPVSCFRTKTIDNVYFGSRTTLTYDGKEMS